MSVNLVTIATFENSTIANIVKRSLETDGITVFLADEMIVDAAWYLSTAIGGVRIQVPEKQVKRAISSLSRFQTLPRGGGDNDFAKVSWADRTVDRMFRVAVISLFFLPLFPYSTWLLARLLISRRRVSQDRHLKLTIAIIMNILVIASLWGIFHRR